MPANDRSDKKCNTDEGHFAHFSVAYFGKIKTHKQGYRNRHRDGKCAPRAVGERVDYRQTETGKRNDDDEQDSEGRGNASDGTHFVPGDLRQRVPVAAHRRHKNYHIVDGAAERRSDEYPQKAGKIPELRSQHRSDERARAGDGGKVVPEKHVFVRGIVIYAVAHCKGRGLMVVGEREYLGGDKCAVKSVRHKIKTPGGS